MSSGQSPSLEIWIAFIGLVSRLCKAWASTLAWAVISGFFVLARRTIEQIRAQRAKRTGTSHIGLTAFLGSATITTLDTG